jgi:hypothetical protein
MQIISGLMRDVDVQKTFRFCQNQIVHLESEQRRELYTLFSNA